MSLMPGGFIRIDAGAERILGEIAVEALDRRFSLQGCKHLDRCDETGPEIRRVRDHLDTDRFRHRLAVIMRKTGLDEAAAREHHRREIGVTRIGEPQDVAALVRFIVSPEGRWLHGSAIDIDGGQVTPLRMSAYD